MEFLADNAGTLILLKLFSLIIGIFFGLSIFSVLNKFSFLALFKLILFILISMLFLKLLKSIFNYLRIFVVYYFLY